MLSGFGALIVLGRHRQEWRYRIPVACVIAILSVSMASRIDLGIRYLLPLYPMLAMIAGIGAASLCAMRSWILLGLLAIGQLGMSAATFPNLPRLFQRPRGSGTRAPACRLRPGLGARRVGSLFDYQSLGEVEVKGLPTPVRAFRVFGESRVGSRYEALRSGESPLIGRGEELELLQRRWDQAKSGEGRVVLISAEPGIGKSRLAEAFRESLGGEPTGDGMDRDQPHAMGLWYQSAAVRWLRLAESV
jgi:hypothetical protein